MADVDLAEVVRTTGSGFVELVGLGSPLRIIDGPPLVELVTTKAPVEVVGNYVDALHTVGSYIPVIATVGSYIDVVASVGSWASDDLWPE